nr:hypothetical protein [Nostoc sp. FACHB-110]
MQSNLIYAAAIANCLGYFFGCAKIESKSSQQLDKTMKAIRQGDVILLPVQQIDGQKKRDLILAEGEVTGHKHQISEGQAELYEKDSTLYLRVLSDIALLTHEEHQAIPIPQGNWIVKIQREYEPEGWRYVAD